MLILTAIQNPITINSPFVTTMGFMMYQLLLITYKVIMMGLQIIPMISLVYTAILLIKTLKKPEKDYEQHPPQKKFLVFVPAHNEENFVVQLIHNLNHQMNYLLIY